MVGCTLRSTRITLIFPLLLILQGWPGVAGASPAADPIRLYGTAMAFDIYRDGDKVGSHTVNFSRQSAETIQVKARFDLTVTFLTIPVYRFLYVSQSTWRRGVLSELKANVDDNGDNNFVAATRSDNGLVIRGPKGVHTWESALYPTNHWNAGVLSQKHVLNTLTGDVASVEIRSEGRDKVEAEGKMIEATRYRYSGDIDTTVWYDDDGRWVKMRFVAKGGSTIDYNCTRCGHGGAQAATAN